MNGIKQSYIVLFLIVFNKKLTVIFLFHSISALIVISLTASKVTKYDTVDAFTIILVVKNVIWNDADLSQRFWFKLGLDFI